jgi:hypothetical protein
MPRVLAPDEKPLHWVGSSKRDFLEFPDTVKDDVGNALGIAQFGGRAPTAKPFKGLGPGVLESLNLTRVARIELSIRCGFSGPSTCCTRFKRSPPPVSVRLDRMSSSSPSA